MTVKFPSVETARIGADTLRAESQVAQKWVKFTDLLRADGITSAMLDSKNGSQELRDHVKDDILAKIGKMEKPAFDAVAVCDHLKKCKGIIPSV